VKSAAKNGFTRLGMAVASIGRMPHGRGRVLIVDDDPEWIETLTDFLVEEGYSVTAAPNGVAALEELSLMEPLVVITDVQMPIMDGRQLLCRVHEQNGRMPVIVVTGERAGDPALAGAFRIIGKPVPVDDLLSAIAEATAHRIVHLPLHKLWSAAGKVTRSRGNRVAWLRRSAVGRAAGRAASSPAVLPIVLLIVLVSSLALLNRWRASRK
jgi:CheY-like chemotaxis protein